MTLYNDLSITDFHPEEMDSAPEFSKKELKDLLDSAQKESFDSLFLMLDNLEQVDAELLSMMEHVSAAPDPAAH